MLCTNSDSIVSLLLSMITSFCKNICYPKKSEQLVSQHSGLCITLGCFFPPPVKRTWFHEAEIYLTQSSLFTVNTKFHFLGKVNGVYFLAQIFQVFSLSFLAHSQGHTCFSYCFQSLISICFWKSSQFQPKNTQFCTLISLQRQLYSHCTTSAETLNTSGALA